MPVAITKEFVVSVENQPGAFADIASALALEKINIDGFIAEGRGEFGVLRLVTDAPERTERLLVASRVAFRANDVLSVRVPNEPGQLARIAQLLAASGVNVTAAYASATRDGAALLTFVPDDVRSAQKVLGQL